LNKTVNCKPEFVKVCRQNLVKKLELRLEAKSIAVIAGLFIDLMNGVLLLQAEYQYNVFIKIAALIAELY